MCRSTSRLRGWVRGRRSSAPCRSQSPPPGCAWLAVSSTTSAGARHARWRIDRQSLPSAGPHPPPPRPASRSCRPLFAPSGVGLSRLLARSLLRGYPFSVLLLCAVSFNLVLSDDSGASACQWARLSLCLQSTATCFYSLIALDLCGYSDPLGSPRHAARPARPGQVLLTVRTLTTATCWCSRPARAAPEACQSRLGTQRSRCSAQ